MADALFTDYHAHPDALIGRILNAICRLFAVCAGSILILMALMSLASIVGRTFFGHPILGDYELVQMMSAIGVSMALPFCQMVRGHIIVDFFTTRFPPKVNKALDVIASILLSLVAFVLTWRISVGFSDMLTNRDASMLLNIPTWWAYVPMIPSFFLLGCAALYTAWVDFAGARA